MNDLSKGLGFSAYGELFDEIGASMTPTFGERCLRLASAAFHAAGAFAGFIALGILIF